MRTERIQMGRLAGFSRAHWADARSVGCVQHTLSTRQPSNSCTVPASKTTADCTKLHWSRLVHQTGTQSGYRSRHASFPQGCCGLCSVVHALLADLIPAPTHVDAPATWSLESACFFTVRCGASIPGSASCTAPFKFVQVDVDQEGDEEDDDVDLDDEASAIEAGWVRPQELRHFTALSW